ncbi:MAG: hypothetical protein A3C15_02320 [Candidatus Magasanikbacteria bacterium RIFCSPHIGHO2_02_FULL_50_9b]|uniref:Uncharacterized protein n=1 Tax=Candidatus Magasanikbacteria bacterium RIFCSPHIGHO2_02_FULL_50_9b TaxID=1798682 RepID=A0A1F6M7N6_9BACT|nr:MAG: hypothetical protein A3C15_02320 [Candidatus Magasanikbacteria bacterium RIFCSPHIGHO2_02_FULL_50_9b]
MRQLTNEEGGHTASGITTVTNSFQDVLVQAKLLWCERRIAYLKETLHAEEISADHAAKAQYTQRLQDEISQTRLMIAHLTVYGTEGCEMAGDDQCAVEEIRVGVEKRLDTFFDKVLLTAVTAGMCVGAPTGFILSHHALGLLTGLILGVMLAGFTGHWIARKSIPRVRQKFNVIVAKDHERHASCKTPKLISESDADLIAAWVSHKINGVRETAISDSSPMGKMLVQLQRRMQEAANLEAAFQVQVNSIPTAESAQRTLIVSGLTRATQQHEQLSAAHGRLQKRIAEINAFLDELFNRAVGASSSVRQLALFERLHALEDAAAADIAEAESLAFQTIRQLELRLAETCDAFQHLQAEPAFSVAAHGTEGLPMAEQLRQIDDAVAAVVAFELPSETLIEVEIDDE